MKNLNNVNTGLFVVSFFEDNSTDPNFVKRLIGQSTINLGAGETKPVQMSYVVPLNGGSFVISAVADSTGVVEEAPEFNNTATTVITARPDPKIGPNLAGDTATARRRRSARLSRR